jgi:hypothetical protein
MTPSEKSNRSWAVRNSRFDAPQHLLEPKWSSDPFKFRLM